MAPFAGAELLPALPSESNASPHKLFIASDNNSQSFDSWTIDGGYAYNVFEDIDLYVGARINNNKQGENGWLSGIRYQFTERLSFKSTLLSTANPDKTKSKEAALSAELSSRLKLSENLDLHATLDYQEWQQGVEFGIGFRF
ncbi:hypothetical protein ACP45F_03385 [Vibrio metoecus]|uniref:Uncharacterized protein n=1 Tax=Vibrio metoecus TaxID=1481663 RepID=A0A0Q0PV44_VIBMT|nr:hypothetical protein [Vibrio metoecus]KQA23981.1 hypothetical protein AAY55_05820 [Vibrio metoecus]